MSSLTDEEVALLIPSALRGVLETTGKFSLQPVPEYFEADFARTSGIILSVVLSFSLMILICFFA